MHDFRKLKVWFRSKDLARDIYIMTKSFPKEEIYGITSQMRKAAVSISANIAEGSGRSTNKDFAYFINISIGSLNELLTYLEISYDLGFIDKSLQIKVIEELMEIKNMLFTFQQNLRNNL